MEKIYCFVFITLFISICLSFRVRRDYSCGSASYYKAPNGTIKSHGGYDFGHNYGKNMRCTWTIEAQQGWHVELVADSFDLQTSSNCYYDYLAIHDGPSVNSTLLGKYCGSTFNPLSSSGKFLTLQFVTNYATSGAGFLLRYNWTHAVIRSCPGNEFKCLDNRCIRQSYRCDEDDDCGDDTDERNCPPKTCATRGYFPCTHGNKCIRPTWLCDGGNDCTDGSDEKPTNCNGGGSYACGTLNYTGSSGVVTSPGYPSAYATNLACKYHIYAPAGSHNIAISFASSFDIEQDVKCAYDYIKISAYGNTSMHGPFCGKTAPSQFTIPGRHAVIEFNSDSSDTATGFKLTYSAH